MCFRLLKVLMIPIFILALLELFFLMPIIQTVSIFKYIITGYLFEDKEIAKLANRFPIGRFTNWLYFQKKDKG